MTTTTEDVPVRTVRFGPPESTSVLFGLSLPALGVIGGGVGLAYVVMQLVGSRLGLLVGAAIIGAAFAVATIPVRRLGGTVFDQAPTVARFARRAKVWAPFHAGAVLRRRPDGRAFEVESPRPTVPPPLAGRAELLAYRTPNGGDVGVLADRLTGCFTVTMPVVQADFSMRHTADRQSLFDQWGAAVEALFSDPASPVDRLGVYERALPDPADDLFANFDANPHAAALVGNPARESYRRLISQAGPANPQHEGWIAVRINPRKGTGGRLVKQAGGGDAGGMAVAYQYAHQLARMLAFADGLQVAGCLTPAAMARVIRESHDPAWRAAGHHERGTSPDIPWSCGTSEAGDHYATDSAVHRTYEVTGWPQEPRDEQFLAPLVVETFTPRSFAVVFEPVDRRDTERVLRAKSSTRKAARIEKETKDQWDNPAGDDTDDHLDRVAREVARGATEVRFRGYVTFTAPDVDTLDVASSEGTYAAGRAGLQLTAMQYRQHQGFTFGLPICLGLPEVARWRRAAGTS